jgi:hypothetical protein
MRNLATTLRWLNEPERAAELLDIAMSRYERTLGTRHPATLGCMVERANVAFDLRQYGAAKRMAAQAEQAYTQLFPADHPFCLVARNNLGVFIRRLGDVPEGLAKAEQVAADLEHMLGDQHTITALAWVNVANGAAADDDAEYARRMDDRAYEVLRANLRPENIAAIGAAINVAVGRVLSGDHDESDLNRTLAYAEQTLGAEHPIVRRGAEKQRVDLVIEPFVM